MENHIIIFEFFIAILFFLFQLIPVFVFSFIIWLSVKSASKMQKNLDENGIKTIAIVISSQYRNVGHRGHRRHKYITRVMYVGTDNKEHFVVLNTSEEFQINTKIKIRYLPEYPRIVEFCGFIEY